MAARRGTTESGLINRLAFDNRVTTEEAILNCYALVLGGTETARLTLTSAALAFAGNPGQWRALCVDTGDVPTAVEETLRWATPAMHTARIAAEDIRLHGRDIACGDIVTLWIASANRDERVLRSPETFDIARAPNNHLSFGHGLHFCIGA